MQTKANNNSQYNISSEKFMEKFTRLTSLWKENFNEHYDAVFIINGKEDERAINIKISALHVWLFGYEFSDSLLILTKNSMIFLASSKKISYLEHFKENFDKQQFTLHLITKEQQNRDNFQKIFQILLADSLSNQLKIGYLLKEKQFGPFVQEYDDFMKTQNHTINEVGPLILESLCIKSQDEIEYVQKAGKLAIYFQGKLIEEVEGIIDDEQKVSHSAISAKIESLLSNDNEVKLLEKKFNIEKNFVELSYNPIVQSGGQYDLRPNADVNEEILSYDTIICSVGAKYREYNSNIVRTLFIDPKKEQKQNYNLLYELQNFVISNLKVGANLQKIYENGVNFIKSKNADLVQHLSANFGYGMGLEFKENNLMINGKVDREIKAGMVFNVSVSLSNLMIDQKQYAIQIADTCIVKSEGLPQILTAQISKKYEDVSYSLQDIDEEDKDIQSSNQKNNNSSSNKNKNETNDKYYQNDKKVTRNHKRPQQYDPGQERKRKDHQKQLLIQKQKELEDRLENDAFKGNKKKIKQIMLEKIRLYNQKSDLPKDLKKGQIYVDVRNNALLLPLMGSHVPFHITVLKNVSKHEEGKFTSIRFNFHVPGASSTLANLQFPDIKNNFMYIRELTFRSKDSKAIAENIKKIKEMQKKVRLHEQDLNDRVNMVDQDNLQLIKGKKPCLQDLKIRPVISGRKNHGNLETHANGFRYQTNKNEKIDIIFSNIKHAFFQPCDQELIILLHFHLHNPIIVGKKKTNDVQFYTEAGIQIEDLDMRKRVQNDIDEIEQEERERAQRKKLNQEFEQFANIVERNTNKKVQFERPYRDLGFYGTPSKSNVYLQPTISCLVNLTETPFFVVTFDEIEIAHFERVQYGLKNFDLAIVFKDYDRPIVRISAIPTTQIEAVKNLFDQMDIIYSESTQNIQWNNILGSIKQDPEDFVANGGWSFLQEDDSEQQEQDELVEGDSEFEPEDEGDEVYEDFQSNYSDEDDEYSEEESDYENDEDLSEEGLSWDELEKIAEKKDEQKLKNAQQQGKQQRPAKKRQ